MSDTGELSIGFEEVVLLAVAALLDGAYGPPIRQRVSECQGRQVSIGAVGITLQRLERKGLLTSRESEPEPVRGGRRRRYYAVTEAGQAALAEAERVRECLRRGR